MPLAAPVRPRWLPRPSTMILVTSMALIVIAIGGWLRLAAAPDYGGMQAWGYDLNTGKLFEIDMDLVGPFPAPSGDLDGAPPGTPAGVNAVVDTYGPGPARILFLVKQTDDGQRRMLAKPGADWVDEESDEARQLIQEAMRHQPY